jgi:hypothetical protein
MDVSKEIGRRTIYSANEAAQSFYDLASAGYDVSKLMTDDLIPILDYAAATQSDVAEATQAVMVTLKQFKMEFEDIGHIVDVFTTAITTSFMTMEKMREMMKYAGTTAGILGTEFEETVAAGTLLANMGMEGCYDEKTRVLTNKGFKYFKDLEGNEKFLTYSIDSGELEWQTSTEYFEYKVDKPIYRVKNRYIDLFVTDNHNMLVSGPNDNNYRLEKARDVYGKSVRYKLAGEWNSNNPKYFNLPAIKVKFSTYTKEFKLKNSIQSFFN